MGIFQLKLIIATAIKTLRTDDNGYPISGYTGGIVQCHDAYFINNKTAVGIYEYDKENLSNFVNCRFITYNVLPDDETPDRFVYLQGVEWTIPFKACTFENTVDHSTYDADVAQRGHGIVSVDSKFEVVEKCISQDPSTGECIEWEENNFTGLCYGIHATTTGPQRGCVIRNSNFNSNYTGVYLGSNDYTTIINNDFNIEKPLKPGSNYTIGGLYIDNCTGFQVEGNAFMDSDDVLQTSDGYSVGLIVNDSWEQPTIVYNNVFTNLNYATLAQNDNRNELGDGLQFKCNDYVNTGYDLVVTYEGNPSSSTGIALHQGTQNGTEPEDMAGNLLDIIEPVNGDYDDIANSSQLFFYYYPSDISGYGDNRLEPTDYTQTTVTIKEVYFSPPWTYLDGCPPTSQQGGGIESLKQEIYVLNQKIDSTENVLTLLIDGGDTEELQSDVEYSTPPETMEIYNDLMGETPYLSDTVVSTAIMKEDVIPNAMIRDVMVANPKSAKSDILIDKLNERINPVPEYMKAQILQGRSILSLREETEADLSDYKDKETRILNKIISYYRNDTINPIASADSILKMYQSEDKLWAKYALAFEYLDRDDSINVISTLDTIYLNFELNEKQLVAHEDYEDYFEIITGVKSEGKSIYQSDSADIAGLYEIYDNSNKDIKEKVRNLLVAIDTLTYNEPYIFMDFTKLSEANEEYNYLLNFEGPDLLRVFPNPASNYIIVDYQLEMQTKGLIKISDISGNMIYRIKVSNIECQIVVDTRDWKPGVYIISLIKNDIGIESEKVSIFK